MKAQELRIGNYIYDRGGKIICIDHWETPTKVSEKRQETNIQKGLYGKHPLTEYIEFAKPIPITEERLLNLGFDKVYGNKDSGLKAYVLHTGVFNIEAIIENETEVFIRLENKPLRHIEYIHQLQNLYFDLKQEELTLKE